MAAMSPGTKRLLMWGVPIVLGVVTLVLMMRHSSSSAAAPATSTTPVSTASSVANQNAVDQVATFASGVSQQLADLQATIQGMNAGPIPTDQAHTGHTGGTKQPPPKTATPTSTAVAAYSPQIVQTKAGPMVWLGAYGTTTTAGYTGHNIGGGAPVYFGNATSLSQGTGQVAPHADVYAPAADAGLVTPNKVAHA